MQEQWGDTNRSRYVGLTGPLAIVGVTEFESWRGVAPSLLIVEEIGAEQDSETPALSRNCRQ